MVTGFGFGASVGFGVKVNWRPFAGDADVVVVIMVEFVEEVALDDHDVIAIQSVVADPPSPTVGLFAPYAEAAAAG